LRAVIFVVVVQTLCLITVVVSEQSMRDVAITVLIIGRWEMVIMKFCQHSFIITVVFGNDESITAAVSISILFGIRQ